MPYFRRFRFGAFAVILASAMASVFVVAQMTPTPPSGAGHSLPAPTPATHDAQKRPITASGFVDSGPVVFADVTRAAGLSGWKHTMGAADKRLIIDTNGSGVPPNGWPLAAPPRGALIAPKGGRGGPTGPPWGLPQSSVFWRGGGGASAEAGRWIFGAIRTSDWSGRRSVWGPWGRPGPILPLAGHRCRIAGNGLRICAIFLFWDGGWGDSAEFFHSKAGPLRSELIRVWRMEAQ